MGSALSSSPTKSASPAATSSVCGGSATTVVVPAALSKSNSTLSQSAEQGTTLRQQQGHPATSASLPDPVMSAAATTPPRRMSLAAADSGSPLVSPGGSRRSSTEAVMHPDTSAAKEGAPLGSPTADLPSSPPRPAGSRTRTPISNASRTRFRSIIENVLAENAAGDDDGPSAVSGAVGSTQPTTLLPASNFDASEFGPPAPKWSEVFGGVSPVASCLSRRRSSNGEGHGGSRSPSLSCSQQLPTSPTAAGASSALVAGAGAATPKPFADEISPRALSALMQRSGAAAAGCFDGGVGGLSGGSAAPGSVQTPPLESPSAGGGGFQLEQRRRSSNRSGGTGSRRVSFNIDGEVLSGEDGEREGFGAAQQLQI